MNKSNIIWIAIICISLYLIPNIIYYFNFGGYGLSSDPAIWGQYGDFIGGFINPIFAIINIAALIYLTYQVSHLENDRAKENIKAQTLITLTQMRYNSVSELAKTFDTFINIPAEIMSDKNALNHSHIMLNIASTLLSFRNNSHALFDKLFTKEFDNDFFFPLKKLSTDIGDVIKEKKEKMTLVEKNQKTLKSITDEVLEKQHTASEEELTKLLEKANNFLSQNEGNLQHDMPEGLDKKMKDYLNMKTKFINEVNRFIINEMSSN